MMTIIMMMIIRVASSVAMTNDNNRPNKAANGRTSDLSISLPGDLDL